MRTTTEGQHHASTGATVVDVYDHLASTAPGEGAVSFAGGPHSGERLTWRQLRERSNELTVYLARWGMAPGVRCGLVLDHHPTLLPMLLALWRRGCVVVPLDPLWGAGLRASIVEHSGITAIAAVDSDTGATVESLGSTKRPPVQSGTALISYTSGSTSDPKGVLLRHCHLLSAYSDAAVGLRSLLGETPRRMGCSMRLSGLGVLGMHYLWAAVLGAELVVLPELSIRSAARYWDEIADQRIELAYLVPPLLELLNRVAEPLPRTTLQVMLTGGAPLPEATRLRFYERFGELLLNAYGLTEVAFAAFLGDRDEKGRGTERVGLPRTVKARLRVAGRAVGTGPGLGELELRGACVSDGYYENREANLALFTADGWLRTGDFARRDGDGGYQIVGRTKWAVMRGAHTVYLNEVEDAAVGLPGVVEAAAVRLDLPSGGEDIGLIVRADGRADPPAVASELMRRLGPHRAPRLVMATQGPLPRAGLDKLDRPRIQRLWDQLVSTARGQASDRA